MIIGIDPGKDGAWCLMNVHGHVVWREKLPDLWAFCDTLEECKKEAPIHVWLEKAQVMAMAGKAKPGAVSSFSYGQGYGKLEGALIALRIPHTVIQPSVWTRVMHAGANCKEKGRKGAKKRSYEVAQRLYPSENFRATERSKKPHDGIIDSLLIGEYGRRQLYGSI